MMVLSVFTSEEIARIAIFAPMQSTLLNIQFVDLAEMAYCCGFSSTFYYFALQIKILATIEYNHAPMI